jgi:hypothetical protein
MYHAKALLTVLQLVGGDTTWCSASQNICKVAWRHTTLTWHLYTTRLVHQRVLCKLYTLYEREDDTVFLPDQA